MANINDSIQLNNAFPLDARTKIASLAAKGTIVNPYVGLPVWVDDPGALYVVKSTYLDNTTLLTKVDELEEVSARAFVIDISDTEFSELAGAITSNKIIVIEDGDSKYFASVGVTNNQNEYLLSYVDSNGTLNQITANSSGYTQTTKSLVNYFDFTFDSSNSANTTPPADLKEAVDAGKLIRVNGYVATKAECFNNAGTTFVNLYYYDDEGKQHHIYKNATTQLGYREDKGGALSDAVTTEASSGTFSINNSDGDPVGTITLSTAANGAAKLTFTDDSNNTFDAVLPNLTFDSQRQVLQYVDAGNQNHDLIRLSNLQIKEAVNKELGSHLTVDLAFTTQTVDGETYYIEQSADNTYTLGDLILALESNNGTDYILWVCDQCDFDPSDETYTYHFVNVGSINDVSLDADYISFSSNVLESTNVQGAIEEVVKGHSVEHTSDYVNVGYLNSVGVPQPQGTNYKYTTPIQVSKGEIIAIETIASISSNIALICKCQSDGTYIKTLLVGDGVGTGTKVYTYTVKEDCYVILSALDTAKTTFIYDRSGTNTIREDVDVLEEDVAELKEAATGLTDVEIDFTEYEEEDVNIDQNGKWYLGNARYTGYLIPVLPNRTYVLVGKDDVDNNHQSRFALLKNINNMVTGGTPAYVDGQSGYVKVAPNETKVVETPSDANYMWVSKLIPVSGETTNIDTLMESVTLRSTIQDIKNDIAANEADIDTLQTKVTTIDNTLNGIVREFNASIFVNEHTITADGVIDESNTYPGYSHSDAYAVSKGDVIVANVYASNRIAIICACDENGVLGDVLKTGDLGVNQIKEYTYTMLNDGYVKFSAHDNISGTKITITPQTLNEKVEANTEELETLKTKVDTPIGARIRLFPEGTANTPKLPCVCFQFDHVSDAARDGNRQIVSLFESKGVRGGFGYVTGTIDANNVVKEETWLKKYGAEYLEYHKRGWDIINHGLHTAWLDSAHEEQRFWLDDTDAKEYIFKSKYLLEKWGFTVNGWITYNSAMRASLVDYVKLTHAYGATIATNTGEHISNTRSGSPCETVRIGMESNTLAQLKSALDTAITNNKICVFYCHTYEFGRTFPAADNEEFNLAKVEALLDYCIAKRDAGLVYLGSNDECYKYFYGL